MGEPLAAMIARAMGWSLSASTAAAAASSSSWLLPGTGHHLGDNGAALSQRPRLIEHDGVHPGKTFERVAVADEDPERRGSPAADHHRHWRGQPHRARAGDEQYRQGTQHRRIVVAPGEPPHRERPEGEQEYGGDEHPAHPVRQSLQRCLVTLSFLDQALKA